MFIRVMKGYGLLNSPLNYQFPSFIVTAFKGLSSVHFGRVPIKVLGTKLALSIKGLNLNARHFSSLTKRNVVCDEPYSGGLLAIPVSSKINVYVTPSSEQTPPLFTLPGAGFNPGFNSDGSVFLTWDGTNTIFPWKSSTGEPYPPIKVIGNGLQIDYVNANVDASLVAVSYTDFSGGTLRGRGIQIYKNGDPVPYRLTDTDAFNYYIYCTAFNSNGTLLVSGHMNYSFVCCWDMNALSKSSLNNPKQKIPLNGMASNIVKLVFDPTGNMLAGANLARGPETGQGCTGFLTDLNKSTNLVPLYLPEYWTNTCVAFSSDGQTLATGGHYRFPHPDNDWFAVTRLWDMQGKLLNGNSLKDINSPFFGRQQSKINFVGFDYAGASRRVISVDGLSSEGNDYVRSCAVDGSAGIIIDQKPNRILAFSYPNSLGKMKKQGKFDVKTKHKPGL